MKSIRNKLTFNFMLIIIVTVLILEIFLINIVRYYYYNNIQSILTNQIEVSSQFYTKYFSNRSMEDLVSNNIDVFWKQTDAQVQLVDLNGNILMDSLGVVHKDKLSTTDFNKATKGQLGVWTGNVDYYNGKVMAVATPLKANNKIIGIIRFVSSLSDVNNQVIKVSILFLTIGILVIIIVGIVSIFLADSIVEPLKEVTRAAEKIAKGKFETRSVKKNDDEIGKLSDTLNYMAEEIIKKDQLKNEFVSSMSHELRTPLTIIKGWAITLNSDDSREEDVLKDGLTIIEKETERLTAMVEELLDFSKFVSGRIVLRREDIVIKDLICMIEKYMSPRAQREGIKFIVQCDADISVSIDKNRIKQVLINILDNAFKFTENGGEVSLLCFVKEKELFIEVRDTGCGISQEELPKVKEKFYKGKSSKSSNGIGLSICEEIVNLHGGNLTITSELNKGTNVIVDIPLI
ncbi:HAMP domain-containing protein [Clostridium sp. 19966]|uniref:sensor histidine kinase n=1 Tax=Clostridium sp. 19966 TaxID=2768166 RepID=UPI0028DDA3AC|nr:HAMP domain-containing sensor histidine kinase [Clostridium sp. 19966]MDT8716328.1 HAMP domain-containing protein [Clostridium sp. 19966]